MDRQYLLNVLEITGVLLFVLVFLGPLIFRVVAGTSAFAVEMVGLSENTFVLLFAIAGSIVLTFWIVFEIADLFYSRFRTLPAVSEPVKSD